ncbi:hypothetical protein F5B22DRAFT_622762 [Xylaria bambusicola]|uniref:uncharacterized protein n=1 Tax=Xylaria bambusicola TaxID=326684 RepID=UPI0020075E48|nr:uncharacterized protein F5B22DRAFT_622762 [Xylaria bambusicola]KAI0506649.1 hypothetical protein F5B22DRAFT_622762 [Xylaria bambusicola]
MAAATTDNGGTSMFPSLTTTFTPPPQCTNWFIDECSSTNCYVKAFPTGTGICGTDESDSKTSYACYPEVTKSTRQFANGEGTYTLEADTYSPGFYCPLGMTTASSVALLDGVFCCPIGMDFSGGLDGGTCVRKQTEGTFILSTDCTPTTIPTPTGSLTTTIFMYAMPVFLGGQKLVSPSFPSTSNPSSTTPIPSSSSPGDNSGGSTTALKIGLGVAIPLVVILTGALSAFWFIRRHRKKATWKEQQYQTLTPGSSISHDATGVGKPELAGSTVQGAHVRAELDSSYMAAELEARSR